MNYKKLTNKIPFYAKSIEKITKENTYYRKVLYTGINQQFVLMSIPPNDDIKIETHEFHDQFIRIEHGHGIAIIDSIKYDLKDDTGIIIPAGTKHQIINISNTESLKLYTIYSPPEHPDKLIQKNNPNISNPINSKYLEKNEIYYKNKYNKYKYKYIILKNNN
jgi:mannose-6-phosphate isomerase-like protein (cupin superfamily)